MVGGGGGRRTGEGRGRISSDFFDRHLRKCCDHFSGFYILNKMVQEKGYRHVERVAKD
jgi:hypothetical protein